MLSFRISYLDLMKIPYFADTIERGDRGERRAKDRATLEINSIVIIIMTIIIIIS
jgi:hypothetical protein